LWGGYTPKLYDGHFVEDHRDEFEKEFTGAAMLGDQHFTYGAKFVESVKIFTPKAPQGQGGGVAEEESIKHPPIDPYDFDDDVPVTRSQQKVKSSEDWDKAVSSLRSWVETIFGFLKNNFSALATPFQESPRQHDYLV
jgi:hypothetical protein